MLWLLLLILLLWIALFPIWPYGRGWGYYPFGAITAILLIFLIFWWIGLFAVTF